MKREDSRFTTKELNIVADNWEKVANEFNGNILLKKVLIDNRSLLVQTTKLNGILDCVNILCKFEIRIPFDKSEILVKTSETMPPTFEYVCPRSAFSFSISNEDIIEKFIKLFGHKELQVDVPAFDKKFLLETNHDRKFKQFLDDKVRSWLEGVSLSYFDLNTPKSQGKLSIFLNFDEFSLEIIKEQVMMFQYCIKKLKNINVV